jgi:hypothetical protein
MTPTLVVRRLIRKHGARVYQADSCWRAIIVRMCRLSSQVFIRYLSGRLALLCRRLKRQLRKFCISTCEECYSCCVMIYNRAAIIDVKEDVYATNDPLA